GGWLAEAEISYAGFCSKKRARLAAEIIRKRIGNTLQLRADLIGALSILADDAGRMLHDHPLGDARDVRLRMAAAHPDRATAALLLRDIIALHTCVPASRSSNRTS